MAATQPLVKMVVLVMLVTVEHMFVYVRQHIRDVSVKLVGKFLSLFLV